MSLFPTGELGFPVPPATVRVLWRGTTPDSQTGIHCARRVHLRDSLLRLRPAGLTRQLWPKVGTMDAHVSLLRA